MERYAVKQLAQLAGISVRTLHLYDQMGLLKPSIRTEKRYRLYGKAELLRLQQILLYKAMDMPLKEIGNLLDDPMFDALKALEKHKTVLEQKQERLNTLLNTIDKTINHLKNSTMLQPEELYEGLSKETVDSWRKEAREQWSDAVERSEHHLRKKSKADFTNLKADAAANRARLSALRQEDPASDNVQQEIRNHYEIIREFWGTAGSPDRQADAYAGLGDLYVSDERYTSVDGKPDPQFAQFMSKAMKHFAKKLK